LGRPYTSPSRPTTSPTPTIGTRSTNTGGSTRIRRYTPVRRPSPPPPPRSRPMPTPLDQTTIPHRRPGYHPGLPFFPDFFLLDWKKSLQKGEHCGRIPEHVITHTRGTGGQVLSSDGRLAGPG